MKELKLAVIGKDVSESTSPQAHAFIAKEMGNKVDYTKISLSENEFNSKIGGILERFDGFNVTIPYKLAIIPYLKKICGDAEIYGAVNTVTTRDLCGYNTDGSGFVMMIENNAIDVNGKEVLVLGAGGAGRSVSKKLLDCGAKVCVYDRFEDSATKLSEEFEGILPIKKIIDKPYYLIVNATGVGMHKTVGQSPVGDKLISLCDVAVDLIYTPKKSRFLEIAETYGKKAVNGEGMLFYQAYFSECIYFGVKPDNRQAEELFKKYGREK